MQLGDLGFRPGSCSLLGGAMSMPPLLSGPQFPSLYKVQVEIHLISVLVTIPVS